MKKISTFSIICWLLLPTWLISCSGKGGTTDEPQATRSELITSGTWKYSSASWGGTDGDLLFQNCQKDNIVDFLDAAVGAYYEGATRCSGSDPDMVAFNWSFQSSETILVLNTPLYLGGGNTHTIVKLTDTELAISQPYSSGGTTKLLIINFVH